LEPKNSDGLMGNKKGTAIFLSSVASGIIVAVVSAILIGEGRFAPEPSPSDGTNSPVSPSPTTESEPENLPTPSPTPSLSTEPESEPTPIQSDSEVSFLEINDIQIEPNQPITITDQKRAITQTYDFSVPANKTLTINLNGTHDSFRFSISSFPDEAKYMEIDGKPSRIFESTTIDSNLTSWEGSTLGGGNYRVTVYSHFSTFNSSTFTLNILLE